MKNGGGGAPENKLLKRLLKKNCGFTLIGVILNLFQDLKRKSLKYHIDLPKQKGILRQWHRQSLSRTNHAQNDMAFKIGTNNCHPEGEVRRISKKNEQEIFCFAQKDKKCAFTLAEVLITLGIIGIVAAMTIPGVIEGYKKKETVAKLQKAYTILNQAFKRSQIDNGEYQYWSKGVDIGIDTYYKLYWRPYFQVMTVCDTYQECGYKSNTPWLGSNNQKMTALFSHKDFRVPFLTSDGILYSMSIASGQVDNSFQAIWVDINGPKNPNQYGIDVFLFVPTENNVIMPYGYDFSESTIAKNCSINGTGEVCAKRLMEAGWKISDDYPW